MKNRLSFKYLMCPMLAFSLHVGAATSNDFVELLDHVPTKGVNKATQMHPLDPNQEIHVNFVLPLRNQKELDDLLERIQDPADHEHYGKHLTSEEFIGRFAPLQEDYDKVVAYANSLGLTVQDTHANRTLLHVSGPTQAIEAAFNLLLHQYMLPEGRQFYAPSKNPEVHTSLASVVNGIVGLDSYAEWHSYHHRKETSHSSLDASQAFPSGPGGGFAPKDIKTAYNLSGVTTNGSNQIIALFELASYQASDITTYTSHFGLPSPKLKNILVAGGSSSGIDAEVTLDIELAIALAPQSEIYVYEGPNSNQGVLGTYNRIATDNLAKQVSTSWGSGEDTVNTQYLQAESAIFKQMAAQGQTIYAAAGDSGAYDDYPNNKSLIVDDPASQPYVVGVGGTSLKVNTSTGAYLTESVWNNGLGNGAAGGGVSAVWPIPSWQTNVSTVYSKSKRNVPDVALDADPDTGYAIYFDGKWQIFGGTSCAAPLWAAFTACVNQELTAANKPALGFANPKIYAIGTGAAYTTDFHDITIGNNLFYHASKGYDNASGWGSFNGANLYANLTSANSLSITAPHCHILFQNEVPFIQGKTGTYEIVVSNSGNASTTHPVTVTINLPAGVTYSSFTGDGWSFNHSALSFTHGHVLHSGSKYPAIQLHVEIADTAPSSLMSTATVSGGGSPCETVTNVADRANAAIGN